MFFTFDVNTIIKAAARAYRASQRIYDQRLSDSRFLQPQCLQKLPVTLRVTLLPVIVWALGMDPSPRTSSFAKCLLTLWPVPAVILTGISSHSPDIWGRLLTTCSTQPWFAHADFCISECNLIKVLERVSFNLYMTGNTSVFEMFSTLVSLGTCKI